MIRNKLKTIIKFGITIFLIAYVVNRAGPQQIYNQLSQVELYLFIAAVILGIVDTAVSALRWKYLLELLDETISFVETFYYYYLGSFFSTVLPFRAGGDLVKAAGVSKSGTQNTDAFASVFMDRFMGLAAIALVAPCGLLLLSPELRGSLLLPILVTTSATFVLLIIIISRRANIVISNFLSIFPSTIYQKLEKFREALETYSSYPTILIIGLILSLIFQLLAILEVSLLAASLGIQIPLYFLVAMVPILSLILFLPISIQGFGVREVAYVVFLSSIGIPEYQAASLSILTGVHFLVNNLIGSIGLLWSPSSMSDRST